MTCRQRGEPVSAFDLACFEAKGRLCLRLTLWAEHDPRLSEAIGWGLMSLCVGSMIGLTGGIVEGIEAVLRVICLHQD
jgi:hypothetical protein